MTSERTRINHNGIKYTNSDLMKIGNEVAALWGASCFGYRINRTDQAVIFECVEYGEFFVTRLTFDELEEEYR